MYGRAALGSARPFGSGLRERLWSARVELALWLAGTAACAVISVLMWIAVVPGWDAPAHLYKAELIRDGYSMVWDNFWYGGAYGSITYGFLYYWLVQYVPSVLVVVFAAGVVPPLFYVYQRRMWGIDDVWPAVFLVVEKRFPEQFYLALFAGHVKKVDKGDM